jgi:multimeric flavodoxin WrbA
MKVLLINGSLKENGSTSVALKEIVKSLSTDGIDSEIVTVGNIPLRDCAGCAACRTKTVGKCIYDDDLVNPIIEKARNCDGFIFASPVYYAHPSGRILSLLDRLFYAGGSAFAYKPGAAVAVARRAGTVSSVDVLNKYFTINNMPVVSSEYWNNAFAAKAPDMQEDKEGLQIMRMLGHNMAWLLKCIDAGKKNGIDIPVAEQRVWTNFVS